MIYRHFLCSFLAVFILALTAGCALNDPKLAQLTTLQQQQDAKLQEQSERLARQEQNLAQIQQNQTQLLQSLDALNQQVSSNNAALNQQLDLARARAKPAAVSEPLEVKKTSKNPSSSPSPSQDGKPVIGRVEWVWMEALHRKLKARIDTGATLSSIHATKIERFERDGKNWVRFTMRVNTEGEEGEGETDHVFEAPLARNVRIRQASSEELDTRPVVRLKVKLGKIEEDCDFTLTNRDLMNYPVLLGRKFLRDIVIVDVALKFTQTLEMPKKP